MGGRHEVTTTGLGGACVHTSERVYVRGGAVAEWRLTRVPSGYAGEDAWGIGGGRHEAGVSPCHASDLLLDPGSLLPLQASTAPATRGRDRMVHIKLSLGCYWLLLGTG